MNAPVDLSGKSVAITGASMGIGFAVARTALEAGARGVTICARDSDGVTYACERLSDDGFRDRVRGLAADVSRAADVERFFAFAHDAFGAIDAVVHAAAVVEPIGSILDVDPQQWLRAVEIDLFGSFLVARAACERMRERGGRIVLFSGGGASFPWPEYTAYACSKVAVVRLVETIAMEMQSYGIEINALAPGMVATRMLERVHAAAAQAGRAVQPGATPERAAHAAAFLISPAAAGISGKFVSANYDDYAAWPQRLETLHESDVFTLRRIVPKDRGMTWQ